MCVLVRQNKFEMKVLSSLTKQDTLIGQWLASEPRPPDGTQLSNLTGLFWNSPTEQEPFRIVEFGGISTRTGQANVGEVLTQDGTDRPGSG